MNVLVQSSYLCSPAGSRGLNNSLRGRVREGGKRGKVREGGKRGKVREGGKRGKVREGGKGSKIVNFSKVGNR